MKNFKVRIIPISFGDGSLRDKKEIKYGLFITVKAKSQKEAEYIVNTQTHCRVYI